MKKLLASVCLAAIAYGGIAWADPKGTFIQAYEYGFGDRSSLDPISNGRVFQITEKLMSRLVRPDMSGIPSPDLAISWESNADATEWIFQLREGVSFHDGSPFGAEDVVYSLDRVLDPASESPARSAVQMITGVEAVDGMTVKLTLDTPFADLPLQLMDYRLRIIPLDSGETIGLTGIGTGPFKLEKFDAAGTTTLVANNDYYEGPPGVARMEIIAIPDAQARLQALLGGQIDMESGITPQQRIMFDSSDKFYVQEVLTGNWRGIVFRTDLEPYTDPRVRKALRLAADREELMALVEGGKGTVTCDNPVGPTDQYRAEMSCPQDIEAAKALLEEAGFPGGIDLDIYTSTIEATWPALAEAYQEQAAAAGIRVNIVQVPTDGYWSDVWMKQDVTMTRWNERPADQVLHEVYLGGAKWNESYYADAAFDALLEEARRELNFDKRKAVYNAAQEHLWETTGTLIPYHVVKLVGVTARVRNLDAVENMAIRWNLITVDD